MKKLVNRSCINQANTIRDSLKEKRVKMYENKYNIPLLCEARDVWIGFEPIRKTRLRNIRYVYGDQWGDLVKDENGNLVTERTRINKRTGGVALQNNHLLKVVTAMAGIYVKSTGKPVVYALQKDSDIAASMVTNAIQKNYENNLMDDLMADELIEMLLGGIPVLSDEWTSHDGLEDDYTYVVNPSYFAFRSKGVDPRLWDVDLIVEIRDYTMGELKAELVKTPYDSDQLDVIYAPYLRRNWPDIQQTDRHKAMTWETPPGVNLCRTYRVWTQEYKLRYRCVDLMDFQQPIYKVEQDEIWKVDAENEQRKADYRAMGIENEEDMILIEKKLITDQYWHFWLLAPDGRVLDDYDSPYAHGSHPYIFTAHQYVNGNVYPFISVIIDQQRYINRLITLQDLMISSSIHGLKMVPKTMLGGLSPKQFAKRATELGGWIFYEPDERFPNLAPTVIQSQSRDVGISEMLKLQLDNVSEITNMSDAIRGVTPNSGTPASRYALQTENSITSLAAMFKKFNTFENKLAKKKLKNILENYTEPRKIAIQHTNGVADITMFDPSILQDIDFDATIRQAPDTPVARMTNNDLYKEMWLRGMLNTQQLLKYSDLPGTEQLAQDLNAMQEAGQQQNAVPQQLNSQAAQQVTAGANQDTVSAIQDALRKDLGSMTDVSDMK